MRLAIIISITLAGIAAGAAINAQIWQFSPTTNALLAKTNIPLAGYKSY